MDVLADGAWEKNFYREAGSIYKGREESMADGLTDVTLDPDAFFPFSDNIEHYKSGVKYIAEPGGSVRDDAIDTCNKYGMVMAFTGIRLFHH